MSEETWHEARLIPTSGISGPDEQERRATSALLAVMSAVKEFGRAVTAPIGAPSGTVSTYIEVPFTTGEKKCIPDGLIRVARGQRSWTALVEVKTGTNTLQNEQLEAYLDVARDHGFDALLTISNEIPPAAGQHPTKVDKRKLKKVALHHLSWSEVLAEAVMQKEHRGVADPDQAWILGELIRYLEHPRSGALDLDDMGAAWVPVRDAIAAGTLRANDKLAPEVAARFDALLRYASLRLGRRLGADVTPLLSRKDAADPTARSLALVQSMAATGTVAGAIRIPNTVGPLHVTLDLRAGKITCHVDIDAPKEGRPATRVNWLVRQLKDAPDQTRVEAFAAFGRGSSAAELLKDVRENPALLVPEAGKELRQFRIAIATPLGPKRGRGRGGAIDSVLEAVDGFYGSVLQQVKAWAATPPKLRESAVVAAPADVEQELVSTAMSSQDGPVAEAHVAVAEPTPHAAVEGTPADEDPRSASAALSADEAPASWNQPYEPILESAPPDPRPEPSGTHVPPRQDQTAASD